MMQQTLKWAAAVWLICATSLTAETRPVVVELFTSQGCSSCPPADAFMHKLAAREDVIALALHVDYWDYIGWKDSFAKPAHTARQHAYARAGGRGSVYTPQMIISGTDHVVGNHPKDVSDLIRIHAAKPQAVVLEVIRKGNRISIRSSAAQPLTAPLVVQMARYSPKQSVAIKRGENAGKTISYANVVTELSVLGEWDTRRPLQLDRQISGDQPVVIILQRKGAGMIEAAARLP